MEDAVYICKWKRSRSGYRLWLKGKPWVRVSGDGNVRILEEELSAKISDWGGAHHAVLEFEPPLPQLPADVRYSVPEIYSLCGDDRVEIQCPDQNDRAWFDSFFEQPHCGECGSQASQRNAKQFHAKHVRTDYDGGFISVFGAQIRVFSDEFLALLTKSEGEGLRLQRVQYSKRTKKKFFELVGPATVPFAAVSDFEPTGWRCGTCNVANFSYWSRESAINNFVAKSKLPDPLPGVFTVGCPPGIELCMTADRWSQLRGKKGAKGIVSTQIGVASDSDIVLSPELPTPREHARASARKWRRKRKQE